MNVPLPAWAHGLTVSQEDFEKWTNEAGQNPVLQWCIENQKIDEDNYLAWASKAFNIPSLQKEFFDTAQASPEVELWMTKLPKTLIPVMYWEEVLYICCLDPSEIPTSTSSPQFQPLLGSWLKAVMFRDRLLNVNVASSPNLDSLSNLDFGSLAISSDAGHTKEESVPASSGQKTVEASAPEAPDLSSFSFTNVTDSDLAPAIVIQEIEDYSATAGSPAAAPALAVASAPAVTSASGPAEDFKFDLEVLPPIPDSQLPVAARIKVQSERNAIQPATLADDAIVAPPPAPPVSFAPPSAAPASVAPRTNLQTPAHVTQTMKKPTPPSLFPAAPVASTQPKASAGFQTSDLSEEPTKSGVPQSTLIMALASEIPHVPGVTSSYTVPGKIKPSQQGPKASVPPPAFPKESPGAALLRKPVRLNDFNSSGNAGPWAGAPVNLQNEKVIKDSRTVERLDQTPLFLLPQFRKWFDQTMILIIDGGSVRPWRWDESWRLNGTALGSVDLEASSAFRVVYRSRHSYHGRVTATKDHMTFFENWNGGMKPGHLTLVPMFQNEVMVAMVLGATTLEKGMKIPLDECEALARLMSSFFARQNIQQHAQEAA